MSQETLNSVTPDTKPIYRLIRKTRHLLRSTWVITGLGLTVGLLLGALVAMTAMDLTFTLKPEIDSYFRLAALLVVAIPSGWAFFAGVVRPLFRRLRAGQVARKIESHIPGIHNRLVSCIDLTSRETASQPRSEAFYRRLVTEAVERIRGFRASKVVDFLSLRRAGLFAACSLTAFFLVMYLFSDSMPTVMARILNPFKDIPPVSSHQYALRQPVNRQGEAGDVQILRGDDITFAVEVLKGSPKDLYVELKSAKAGQTIRHELSKQEGNLWKKTLNSSSLGAGFEDSFRFRVRGGGTWSKQYQVELVERPVITNLYTVLHYPSYMGLEPRENRPQGSAHADAADVSGPEQSEVEVVVQAEGKVAEGAVQWLESRQSLLPVALRPEKAWFEEKLPEGSAAEGGWQWDLKGFGRPAHTDTPSPVEHRHYFQNAPAGFTAAATDWLFTYVYIVPGQEPAALMVQWHDGANWEHGAFWGDETKVREGKRNTPSRRELGALPPSGQWVRLEVPAEHVNMQGKDLRGMSFILYGGQCYWHKAGTIPPREIVGQTLVVKKSFPMQRREDDQWSGRFPLVDSGIYRVELKNERGDANKPMKEANYRAFADKPPLITMKYPAEDKKFSKPEKQLLILETSDDFGLADVNLFIQQGDKGTFESKPIVKFDKPQPGETIALRTTLDLPALNLKQGDYIRYRAEARDRKEQTAKTPDFMIRIQTDANSADQQLAAFEKQEDPFREKLIKLIGDQAKVQSAIDKMEAKYAKLDEKIRAAKTEAKVEAALAAAKADPTKPAPAPQPLKLDPESEKALQALRQELTQLFPEEQKNVALAQQMAGDIGKMLEQALGQKLSPEIAAEKQALKDLFQKGAVDPLQELTAKMQQGANAQQAPPDLKELKEMSERLQKELEALRNDVKALAEARQKMKDDPEEGHRQHQRAMNRKNAGLTARDLEDLKNFIASLRKDLRQMEGEQEELNKTTRNIPEALLKELEKQQDRLDQKLDPKLQDAKDLQNPEKKRRVKKKRDPHFPKSPYDPERDEEMVRPKEEDTDEDDPKKDKKKEEKGTESVKGKETAKEKEKEKEEELFLPQLGGPKPKEDPRFANKKRPVAKKPKDEKTGPNNKENDPKSRRDDLDARQNQNLDDLNKAQQSLESDEQALDQILQQLKDAMSSKKGGREGRPKEGGGKESDQQMDEMMESPLMQQAKAMAARMKGMRGNPNRQRGPQTPPQSIPTTAAVGDLAGANKDGKPQPSELGKLDPEARSVIMKMPERMQQELLQSMREEGPDGYKKFIKDYFNRLGDVQKKKGN